MTLRSLSCLLLAVICGSLACHDASDDHAPPPNGDSGQADAGAATFRLDAISFNMALTESVKGPAERLPAIIAALIAADADVLCLQEAFEGVAPPPHVAALLEDHYPHAFHSPLDKQTPLGAGLLLVSKYPFEVTDALRFSVEDPFKAVDRSVLLAELNIAGQPVRIACAHLNPGLAPSGVASRGQQVTEIFAFLDAQPAIDGPVLLLGDLNAGPDPIGACTPTTMPACVEPDTQTYDLVLTRFTDANAELDACTQCRDQFAALQAASLFSNEPDQRIDHCFVANLAPYVHLESSLALDGEVAIDANGETLAHLSDHRGIRCVFGVPSTSQRAGEASRHERVDALNCVPDHCKRAR